MTSRFPRAPSGVSRASPSSSSSKTTRAYLPGVAVRRGRVHPEADRGTVAAGGATRRVVGSPFSNAW